MYIYIDNDHLNNDVALSGIQSFPSGIYIIRAIYIIKKKIYI